MKPDVSVVIVTYNRATKLRNLLQALHDQRMENIEVIVVIDGSTDATREMLVEFQQQSSFLRFVYHQNQGRSVSRNLGARLATADLIIFFDDDMLPLPNCLDQHLDHHQKQPNTICVGTQEEDPSRVKNDFDLFRYVRSLHWVRNIETSEHIIPVSQVFLSAANFSISKELFEKLGGFDRKKEVVEDFDLAVRAVRRGILIFYRPSARAFHDNILTCSEFVKKQRQYAESYLRYSAVQPELEQSFSALQRYRPSFLKRLFYFVFSTPFFVRLVDSNVLQVLPRRLRFEFYAVVVTGMAKVFPSRIKNLA